MPVDINREIGRIRGLPGQNWHASALKALQDYVNTLPISATKADPPAAKVVVGSGGGGASTDPPATSDPPPQLAVNGQTAPAANFNSAFPAAPAGSALATFQMDALLPVPFITVAYNNLANSRLKVSTVLFNATPVFDASLGNMQEIILTADVTSFTVINGTPGQIIVLVWFQDAVGGHAVAGTPANMRGFTTPGTTPSTFSVQSFGWDGNAWLALAAGIVDI